MNIEGIAARHGSLGPRALDALSPAVRRLVDEDLPRLLRVARAAEAMVQQELVGGIKIIDSNAIEALKRALKDGDKPAPELSLLR